jgi:hypothetical protein
MSEFVITSDKNVGRFKVLGNEGEIVPTTVNFRPWATDVTSVTWSVEWNNNVGVSGEVLTDSIATANLTYSSEGYAVVKVTAVSTTKGTKVIYIDVKVGSDCESDYI